MPSLKRLRTAVGKSKRVKRMPLRAGLGGAKAALRLLTNSEERKYIETVASIAAITTTGTVSHLGPIAEGSDFNQRIGRKIRMKYLQYDFGVQIGTTVSSPTAVGPAVNWVAHMVLDRQPNGTAPNWQQVFDTSVSGIDCFAFKNVQLFEERFKILKTHLGQVNSVGSIDEKARCREFIDLSKLKPEDQIMHFAGSGAAVPNTNGLFILFASDSTNNATFQNITYVTRFVYVDM